MFDLYKSKKQQKIPDILVYSTPFEISDDQWGYKWIGFYNGKRFSVIQRKCDGNIQLDEEKGIYVFEENEQTNLLPEGLRKLIYKNPLSNKYFSLKIGKEQSFEIIMTLIENGYDIENDIVCRWTTEYPYQVCEKKNNRILAEIMVDGKVVWYAIKEEKNTMEDKMYLELYKKLLKLYKEDKEVGISFDHKSKKKFNYLSSSKITDIDLEDDYMYIITDNGDISIYRENKISYLVRRDRTYKDKYVIDSDEFIIVIDTEDCDSE